MRFFKNLTDMLDTMPVWGQIAVAVGLIIYSIISVYSRFNTKFGAIMFSKIPAEEIKTNKSHIMQYTIIPAIITFGYIVILAVKYLQN